MVCVYDLPSEIWVSEVVPRVDPIDVLFLGQSCTMFHSLISQKSVWEGILRSTCLLYGLFAPSFPIDDMSVSELQRVSTGPQRWDALLQKGAVPLKQLGADSGPPLPVLASAPLGRWHRDQGFLDGHDVRTFIVPGGRFFVTLRNDGDGIGFHIPTRLELWDLGVPMRRTNAAPTLLAQKDPEWTKGDLFVTAPTVDSDELRVAVWSRASPDNSVKVNVFSITPTQTSPRFEPIASATFVDGSEPSRGGFIHGDFMVFRSRSGRSFTLWNFVEGRFTKVAVRSLEDVQVVSGDEFVLTNDHVVFLGDKVAAWSLSHLRELGSLVPSGHITDSSLEPRLDLPPGWACPLPVPVQARHRISTLLNPVRCIIGIQPSITFDLLTGQLGMWFDPVKFHRYTLRGVSPGTSGPPFRFDRVEEGFLPFGYFRTMIFYGGRIRNNGVDVTCIGPMRNRPDPDTPPHTFICLPTQIITNTDGYQISRNPATAAEMEGLMVTPIEPLIPLASCWTSGRFVYHDFSSHQDSLRLVDYL